MKTTLQKIRYFSLCTEIWPKLLSYLGKTKADDEELPIRVILESNGLDDALWCLQAVEGFDREKRLFAVWCAKQVKHLMTDKRSLDALNIAQKFAEGETSQEELDEAGTAARAAVDEAWTAAWTAARDASRAAARDASRAAAWAEAGTAVDEARDAAWTAAWEASAAARAAARDEAGTAARDASRAAAWAEAGTAAREAQKIEFLRMLDCIENSVKYEI